MQYLLKLISALPLALVRAIGRGVGVLIYRFSSEYRTNIHKNLSRAGIFTPELALEVAREQGAQGVEAPWVWGRSTEEVLARTRCDEAGVKVVNDVFESGSPVVFLTPHIGCYEVAPLLVAKKWLAPYNKDMAILYRVPKKAYLRAIVENGREVPHILPSSADLKGVRQIIKTMRAGGVAGILPDQVPSEGEGVWAPLFGEDAYTMIFPVKLIRQFKARVLMCRVERENDGWCAYIKEWTYPMTGDDETDVCAMNRLIEETILECPSQYLWSYKRYKKPRGAKPKNHAKSA